ncbi:hypothetical protein C823_005657 [Eubacterium plexicaudatum ASF492]|nr:hypothetical protein C823_005657 [Eubacterium plexicaudatum ASF492]
MAVDSDTETDRSSSPDQTSEAEKQQPQTAQVDTENESAKMQAEDTAKDQSGHLSDLASPKDAVSAAEAEIKVNLDAEYFRQKGDGTDENVKQPQNEKLSLLDRLMGKKKTLL